MPEISRFLKDVEYRTSYRQYSPVNLATGAHSWWLGVWDAVGKRTIRSDRMGFWVP
jgi:hypothetical protein